MYLDANKLDDVGERLCVCACVCRVIIETRKSEKREEKKDDEEKKKKRKKTSAVLFFH
mgnify:CR=1 FL=1